MYTDPHLYYSGPLVGDRQDLRPLVLGPRWLLLFTLACQPGFPGERPASTRRPWPPATLALILGTTPPSLSSLLFVLGISAVPGIELTPIVLGVAGLVVGWALFRYRLLDHSAGGPSPGHRGHGRWGDRAQRRWADGAPQSGRPDRPGPPGQPGVGRAAADAFDALPPLAQAAQMSGVESRLEVGDGLAKRCFELTVGPS